MANSILTADVVAKEALLLLENNLVMAKNVYRPFDSEFQTAVNGYTKGNSVRIRKPNAYSVIDTTSGTDITSSFQEVTEGYTDITVDRQQGVPMKFTGQDMTLKIEEFSQRFLQPAIVSIAQKIESDLMGLYSKVWNFSGTAGTVPSTFDAIGGADSPPVILSEMAVPEDKRIGVLNPRTMASLASSLKGYYSDSLAKKALETGMVAKLGNLELYGAQSVPVHTVGALGGTPLVAGTITASTFPDTTTSVTTDGWSNSITGVVKAGDVITFAGVFSVNPRTLASTGRLQNFVVTADANSNGSGLATLIVSPAMIVSGARRTVTNVPADNAAITVKTGTTGASNAQNLVFHPNAFTLVTVPMELPQSAAYKARQTYNGLSIRVVADYAAGTDTELWRLEVLYGVKAVYPELACRLTA
jgi:hypothetical protein